jgi:hypothetical protein
VDATFVSVDQRFGDGCRSERVGLDEDLVLAAFISRITASVVPPLGEKYTATRAEVTSAARARLMRHPSTPRKRATQRQQTRGDWAIQRSLVIEGVQWGTATQLPPRPLTVLASSRALRGTCTAVVLDRAPLFLVPLAAPQAERLVRTALGALARLQEERQRTR